MLEDTSSEFSNESKDSDFLKILHFRQQAVSSIYHKMCILFCFQLESDNLHKAPMHCFISWVQFSSVTKAAAHLRLPYPAASR